MADLGIEWVDYKDSIGHLGLKASTSLRVNPRSSRTRKGLPSGGGVRKTWLFLDRFLSVTVHSLALSPPRGFPPRRSVQFKYPKIPDVLVPPRPRAEGFV